MDIDLAAGVEDAAGNIAHHSSLPTAVFEQGPSGRALPVLPVLFVLGDNNSCFSLISARVIMLLRCFQQSWPRVSVVIPSNS